MWALVICLCRAEISWVTPWISETKKVVTVCFPLEWDIKHMLSWEVWIDYLVLNKMKRYTQLEGICVERSFVACSGGIIIYRKRDASLTGLFQGNFKIFPGLETHIENIFPWRSFMLKLIVRILNVLTVRTAKPLHPEWLGSLELEFIQL